MLIEAIEQDRLELISDLDYKKIMTKKMKRYRNKVKKIRNIKKEY